MSTTSTTYEWRYPHRERTGRNRRTMWIVVGVIVVLLSAGMGLTAPDDAETGDVVFITVVAPVIVVGLALLADRLLFAYTADFALRVDGRNVLHVDRGRRSFYVDLRGATVDVSKVQGAYSTQLSMLWRPSFWYLNAQPAEGKSKMVRLPSGGWVKMLPEAEVRGLEAELRVRTA
ncbi:MAG: hypothetical protein AAGD18_19215 [Actinomycetota bacterium]